MRPVSGPQPLEVPQKPFEIEEAGVDNLSEGLRPYKQYLQGIASGSQVSFNTSQGPFPGTQLRFLALILHNKVTHSNWLLLMALTFFFSPRG